MYAFTDLLARKIKENDYKSMYPSYNPHVPLNVAQAKITLS